MSQGGRLEDTGGGGVPGDVATSYVTQAGTAVPLLNVLNVIGTGGADTSAVGNTVFINVVTAGFTWNVVTSVSPTNPIQIVAQNGYICTGVALVTFLLPLAPTIGDTFKIFSNTSRFQITQNGGQTITIGTATSSSGSGTVTSYSAGDEVTISYMGTNSFQSEPPQGTLTVA
jgi:hypothetical protein